MHTRSTWPPFRRPRRGRATAAIRDLVQETHLTVSDLIAPIFVKDGEGAPENVGSMPGVQRFSVADITRECLDLRALGIRGVALFPCMPASAKDAFGTAALDDSSLVYRALRAIRQAVPGLLVFCDVALDPYTSHGHDGVLDPDGNVNNDATVEILAKMSVLLASAGASFVAPSDMMDGRVGAIRQALDEAGHHTTGILAYAAKFASSFYGPFRDAVGSARPATESYLDKRGYQLNPANAREALLELRLDEEEGADILMVKPAGPYLDIIAAARRHSLLPIAAYQVSGEYSMIVAAAERGWISLADARKESLLSIKRAGADMILSYFSKAVAQDLLGQQR